MDDYFELTDDVIAAADAKLDDLVRLATRPRILCRHDRDWVAWVDRNRRLIAKLPTIAIHINGLHNRHCKTFGDGDPHRAIADTRAGLAGRSQP